MSVKLFPRKRKERKFKKEKEELFLRKEKKLLGEAITVILLQ
jgi:hypothetical protein